LRYLIAVLLPPLHLKHNLNARAIASLKGEFGSVNDDITRLITAMQKAINESNAFIEEMKLGSS